jgi:hypothetical protein
MPLELLELRWQCTQFAERAHFGVSPKIETGKSGTVPDDRDSCGRRRTPRRPLEARGGPEDPLIRGDDICQAECYDRNRLAAV